jgi:hypothetical protein
MDIRRLFLPTSSRAVFAIALLASAAVLLSVLGHWVVQLAAPRSAPRPPLTLPTPTDAAQAIVSRHLFGRATPGEAGAALAATGAVRVLGVASSGPSGGGFAIVSVNGQSPVPAVEGREFSPGMRLNKVTASGIEYEWGGVLHRADLPEKNPASPVDPAAAAAGAADLNRAASPRGRPGSVMPGQFPAATRN